MPGGDRTGPLGYGPQTGRASGFCSGYNIPGYANPEQRLRPGRKGGQGYGRGFRRIQQRILFYPQTIPQPHQLINLEEEKTYLETLAKNLEEELQNVKKLLKEIQQKQKKEEE